MLGLQVVSSFCFFPSSSQSYAQKLFEQFYSNIFWMGASTTRKIPILMRKAIKS